MSDTRLAPHGDPFLADYKQATGSRDPDHVVYEAPGMPFSGLTLAKARTINSALSGMRVVVGGGWFDPKVEEYVFLRMYVPGDWGDGFAAAYDLRLMNICDGRPSPGSYRVLSPSLIWMFLVVEGPELTPCVRCGAWRPQSELRDTAEWKYGIEGYGLACREYCE